MRSPGQNMIQCCLVNTLGSFVMVIPVSIEDRISYPPDELLSAETGLLHTITQIPFLCFRAVRRS